MQVFVRDNDVDQALRALKKKMQREGVFREMKRRRFYEKPSEKAARERGETIRRARKLARKKAQREGLIAAPRGKNVPSGRPTGRSPISVAGGVPPQPLWKGASAAMGGNDTLRTERSVSSGFPSCRAGAKVESLPY